MHIHPENQECTIHCAQMHLQKILSVYTQYSTVTPEQYWNAKKTCVHATTVMSITYSTNEVY